MLIGAGGTGKSTINNIIKMFFDPSDIGVIGNNHQKTFGLYDICNKLAFIAPEIKHDWNIDQAEFQEIVSGGKLNINIKHQSSIHIEWKIPGMLAGNENPGFIDNSSSIQRRLLFTRFDKKVLNSNPFLHESLYQELDSILRHCNQIYLRYAAQYESNDIWNWIPKYFWDTRNLLTQSSHSLAAFLNSDQVCLNPENRVPYDEFFKRYNLFCKDNNYKKGQIHFDFYNSVFNQYNLVIQKRSASYPHGFGKQYTNKQFIIGVDFNN